ncbi:MAG: polyprenol monophosphomannose synthase [Coriobacteriia bacterium]|nr:polyprenol monophosphomannose synthase [Coriobacteriia bacterium]
MNTVLPDSPRAIVVIPTYNEADNVRMLADRVLASMPGIELMIVDDNSPDGTGDIADQIAAEQPRFRVMHRMSDRGYARSSREGLTSCRDAGYDFVLTMDGDLSHDPARIPALLERAQAGAGLVVGSRYVAGGAVEAQWGPIRRAVSQGGSRYARAMIGTQVNDCTSGYRCYSAAALRALRFDELHSEGYSFLIEVLWQLVSAGIEIAEVPITYIDRQHGASKISRRIVLEALAETTGLGLRRVFGR